MGTARHETYICAGARELDAEISADGTGAVDTDFHRAFLKMGCWKKRRN
jgi:hypothetical protein